MFLNDTIFTLFRRVPPEAAISAWLCRYRGDSQDFLYRNPDRNFFRTSMRSEFSQYSPDEVENLFSAFHQLLRSENLQDIGVFAILPYAVKNILCLDAWRECLCRFSKLIEFRELSHPIGQEIFVAAFLAQEDKNREMRTTFSFPPVVRTDNFRLHQILNKGMAENHFHIGGSVHASLYSWICLMNHMNCSREEEFYRTGLDTAPLNQNSAGLAGTTESFYSLTFKATCIRYFLFLRLHDTYPFTGGCEVEDSEAWLAERLVAVNNNLSHYMRDLEERLETCRLLYCDGINGKFVPDYAIDDEELPPMNDEKIGAFSDYAVRNYERRIYRSLAGEQKFQYKLFRAIYENDERIMPYADLFYAYLLIYCKFRSELIQSNKTVGFANFEDYQMRKDNFTWSYSDYSRMRSAAAQQGVLLNPQIRTLEGRMVPAADPQRLLEKITNTYREAIYTEPDYNEEQKVHIRQCAEEKLHYVLHFPKKKQDILPPSDDNDRFEMLNCRNSQLRDNIAAGVNAILRLRRLNPVECLEDDTYIQPLTRITAIDACANEIGCRPEVFAPAFRRICQERQDIRNRLQASDTEVLPNLRITYHVGEDFLDLTDGLRAIDEAICFLQMNRGDRLGHAIALGIDPHDWYASKNNRIFLPRQDLLDNMVWLLEKMYEYNIYEPYVEREIQKVYQENYREVFLDSLRRETDLFPVDVHQYFAAMKLRGNDPMLYVRVPAENGSAFVKFCDDLTLEAALEMWKVYDETEKSRDWIAARLYHHYHFNPSIKRKGTEQTEYTVSYSLVEVIAKVQKEMRHRIARKDIGIETNPTSNYLISTFRDYCKHPIFAFNDSSLYDIADNPRMFVSINTDDLGVFDTSLENEYALMACALENRNEFLPQEERIPMEKIYNWLDHIRQMGCDQSFRRTSDANRV